MAEFETHEFDVLVVGAGGAGLRAAIEASAAGVKVGVVSKIPARQGAHRHGRRRNGRRDGQRRRSRQLARSFRRYHARRAVHEQLADGRDPCEGSPGTRERTRSLGRGIRPHARRQDPPAQFRRPPLSAPGARRRPHRPRNDPNPAGSRHP